jgi:hypothetical protein
MTAKQTEQIKSKILKAIHRLDCFIADTKGSDNPQIAEMRYRAEGKVIAYFSVLDALNGNMAMLNLSA